MELRTWIMRRIEKECAAYRKYRVGDESGIFINLKNGLGNALYELHYEDLLEMIDEEVERFYTSVCTGSER